VRWFFAGCRTPVFNSTQEIAVKKPAMIRVTALKNVRYSGILRVPRTDSAEFDARPADAKVLRALGKVEFVTVPETVVEQTAPVTTAPKAQEPEKAGKIPASKEEYVRRDVPGESLEQRKKAPPPPTEKEEPPKGRSKYLKDDVKTELAK
jgi:hypothetical protein